MGAKGSKLSRPTCYEDNNQRFNSWNEGLGHCHSCGANHISITIINNAGNKAQVIDYYDYDKKYFSFKCIKCQMNFHSKVLG